MAELVTLVNAVYQALNILIVIQVVLSWMPGLGGSLPALRVIRRLTSPILDPIRRLMPPIGGLDLSPVVALMALALVRTLLVDALLAL